MKIQAKTKLLLLFSIIIITAPIYSQPTQAQSFDVGAVVCSYYWVCTDWSVVADQCGTRTCTDLTGCNVTTGKPIEARDCPVDEPASSSGGGGGGGGGGSYAASTDTTGEFSVSTNLLNIDVLPNSHITRRISLISDGDLAYKVIIDPDDSLIETDGEFTALDGETKVINLKVNTEGVEPGLYTYKVIIKNSYREREIFVVVKVSDESSDIDFKLSIGDDDKIIRQQGVIRPKIKFTNKLTEPAIVTYSLINRAGERMILRSERTTSPELNPELNLPEYIEEGFTILEVKIETKDETIIKYLMLVSDPNEEYQHIEEPKEVEEVDTKKLEYTLIAMAAAIVIIMAISIISTYRRKKLYAAPKKEKSNKKEKPKENKK